MQHMCNNSRVPELLALFAVVNNLFDRICYEHYEFYGEHYAHAQ